MGWKLCAAGAAAVGTLAVLPSAASADVSGTCSFKGNATFGHGVTAKSEHNTFDYEYTGSCAGDGNAKLSIKGDGTFGCLGGRNIPITGTLSEHGETIALRGSANIDTPNYTFGFDGAGGGSARGSGQLITPRTNLGKMAGCLGGSGVQNVPTDVKFTTDRALAPAASSSPAPTAPAKKHHKKKHHKKHHHTKKHHSKR